MKKYKANKIDRLDKYVGELENEMSREAIQRMIKSGRILVNGKLAKPSYKVSMDDTITVEDEIPDEIDLKPQEMPLDIIYEDEDLIIINKEKGIVVHPGNRKSRWNTCKRGNGKM